MANRKSERVSEEKMLNDMFVLLEYSDNFKEFVDGMTEDTRKAIWTHINAYFKTEG